MRSYAKEFYGVKMETKQQEPKSSFSLFAGVRNAKAKRILHRREMENFAVDEANVDAFASCSPCLLVYFLSSYFRVCVLFSSSSVSSSFVCLNRVCCAPPFSYTPCFISLALHSCNHLSGGGGLHFVENRMVGKSAFWKLLRFGVFHNSFKILT